MKKIIVLPFLCSLIFANDLTILSKDKKQIREIEKQIVEENYKSLKNDWISTIDLSSGLSRSHSFSDESDRFTKTISLGFSQSIYESGGIRFTIKYADDKYKSDILAWENENKQTLLNIYDILLQMKKLNIQLKQSEYELKNKDIELILKKIQYENGKGDITELNNAIMAKNSQYQQNINLKNSLKEQKQELSKYTDLKYEQIELIDFSNIDKEDFLKKNIELMYEDSLVELANTSYKRDKTNYLPKVSVSTDFSYSNNEDLIADTNTDNSSGSISLRLSMPIYDINKKSDLQKSKLEVLRQKVSLNDLKYELSNDFDEVMTRIDTYKNYNKIINDNINLYNDLIEVNDASNKAGMSSDYDLQILKNTKIINQYDLVLNEINIQQEYAKLYFKIKANN